MAANYAQKFLDPATLITTSRYFNITRYGMHAALERFEQTRKTEARRIRGKDVAKIAAITDAARFEKPTKSVQERGLRGGRYWTRTSDLVRVNLLQVVRASSLVAIGVAF